MKYRKTSVNGRKNYTYNFNDGSNSTLNLEQISEEWIKVLHRFDDNEVYNNLKNSRRSMCGKEKAEASEWDLLHPDDKYYGNWHIHFESITDCNAQSINLDKNTYLIDKSQEIDKIDNPVADRLDEIVSDFTDKRKLVYRLVIIEKYKNTEVAKMLGVTESAVRKVVRKIKDKIKNDELLQKYYK